MCSKGTLLLQPRVPKGRDNSKSPLPAFLVTRLYRRNTPHTENPVSGFSPHWPSKIQPLVCTIPSTWTCADEDTSPFILTVRSQHGGLKRLHLDIPSFEIIPCTQVQSQLKPRYSTSPSPKPFILLLNCPLIIYITAKKQEILLLNSLRNRKEKNFFHCTLCEKLYKT